MSDWFETYKEEKQKPIPKGVAGLAIF